MHEIGVYDGNRTRYEMIHNHPTDHSSSYTINGASGQNRTDDLLVTKELLYQLSYQGKMDARCGFEPHWSILRVS